MARVLVCGNINLETTLRVGSFPVPYASATFVPFGINNSVSGVGYNLAKALSVLGDDVVLAAIIGHDKAGTIIREQLRSDDLDDRYVIDQAQSTPLSVIAYDDEGRRSAFVDVKDLMEQEYPAELFDGALAGVDAALFTQIAYCRPLLARAHSAGKLVATDLQLIADLEDPYKRPYLEAASVLFMSHEQLPETPEAWARRLLQRYPGSRIIGIGMSAEGALLSVRENGVRIKMPAVATRPVVNTSGAGDALFACFMHYYLADYNAEEAMRRAVLFASFKIGEIGSSRGFPDAKSLETLYAASRGEGD